MGEYVWTQIVIGGKATRAVADELETLLSDQFHEQAEMVGAHMVASGERNYGNADDVEAFCQEHDLPYVLTWAAAGGCFDSGSHAWRPGMEDAAEFTATEAGDASVTLAELRRDHEAGVTLAEIISRLSVADSDTLPPFEVEPGDVADAPSDVPKSAFATPRTEFLCVGTYDDGDRFAESVEAFDASEAEVIAQANWPSVTWAGFVALRDGVMTVEG